MSFFLCIRGHFLPPGFLIIRRSEIEGSDNRTMRKLVSITFATLDGIMQGPGGPGEDDSGGFKSGGWSMNYWDDMMGQAMGENFAKQPELLFGRKTYQILAG